MKQNQPMKTMSMHRSLFSVLREILRWQGLILAAGIAMGGRVQAAEPARTTNEFAFPKSVFVHNDAKGKDPFFPNRARGGGTVLVSTNTPVSTGPNLADLQLRGIAGPPERRIALINNLTFSKGEEQEVRAGNSKVKIKVLEIAEKSVSILIDGQTEAKELVLPERLIPISGEE
jgi:hypothetical protein